MANSYNYAALHALGNRGQGKTIAVVDSFGSSTIRQDLAVFNTAFDLPHLCGETGPNDPSGNCPPSVSPRFDIIQVQGGPPPVPPPPNNGTGLEAHNLWDLEVSLDVEWAHATAPLANIMLVTSPTAETLGVQGFQQFMNAEQYVIDHHMADVISQSFASGEGAFHNGLASLKQLRTTFQSAKDNHVTILSSSGDGGSLNFMKEPVKNPAPIPYASVEWPASDPLVTAVGGTYLCTNAETGAGVDQVSPPANCRPAANPAGEREPAWVVAGGGYSIYFPKPAFQSSLPALPAGSSYVGSVPGMPVPPGSQMRGVPDIAYQASSRTGVLVYMTEPNYPSQSTGGLTCPSGQSCSAGWWVVGGTSAGSPQWAGLIAIADQMAGRDLGYLNTALYQLAANPSTYAAAFYDDNTNSNAQTAPGSGTSGNCCPSSRGWDAVTGLGSPNAAVLLPALIAATAGS
jgi:subtilase family serine protease